MFADGTRGQEAGNLLLQYEARTLSRQLKYIWSMRLITGIDEAEHVVLRIHQQSITIESYRVALAEETQIPGFLRACRNLRQGDNFKCRPHGREWPSLRRGRAMPQQQFLTPSSGGDQSGADFHQSAVELGVRAHAGGVQEYL